MSVPRVLSGIASVAAGVALLAGGGGTYGLGVDAAGSAVGPITAGTLDVESTGMAVSVNGVHGAEPVVVPGDTLTITTTATVLLTGDLEAILHLDTTELFAEAPAPVRDALVARTEVALTGLPEITGRENAWAVDSREDPYTVTAVISTTVPDMLGMQEPLSTGALTWSVRQDTSARS